MTATAKNPIHNFFMIDLQGKGAKGPLSFSAQVAKVPGKEGKHRFLRPSKLIERILSHPR
jgi:hypothetical protein